MPPFVWSFGVRFCLVLAWESWMVCGCFMLGCLSLSAVIPISCLWVCPIIAAVSCRMPFHMSQLVVGSQTTHTWPVVYWEPEASKVVSGWPLHSRCTNTVTVYWVHPLSCVLYPGCWLADVVMSRFPCPLTLTMHSHPYTLTSSSTHIQTFWFNQLHLLIINIIILITIFPICTYTCTTQLMVTLLPMR